MRITKLGFLRLQHFLNAPFRGIRNARPAIRHEFPPNDIPEEYDADFVTSSESSNQIEAQTSRDYKPTNQNAASRSREQSPLVKPYTKPSRATQDYASYLDLGSTDPEKFIVRPPRHSDQKSRDEKLTNQASAGFAFRPPSVDPSETSVILFPGFGVQHVGMLPTSLANMQGVKALFAAASEVLGLNLRKLCTEGPSVDLNRLVNAEMATFVCSLAALERLKLEQPEALRNCVGLAGYGVGEYAALVLAGAMSLHSALLIIKARSEYMQRACEAEPSGLATVFLKSGAKLGAACSESRDHMKSRGHLGREPICQIAASLFPTCKVIGGHLEALKFIADHSERYGIASFKMLPVPGALNSPLMQPSDEELTESSFYAALKASQIVEPLLAVHSNLDGKPFGPHHDVRRRLLKGISHGIAWEQTMHILMKRPVEVAFPRIFECGPGSQLKTILQRTYRKAGDAVISTCS